ATPLNRPPRPALGQATLAGSAGGLGGFCLIDPAAVARRISGVLIRREISNAPRDHLVERMRERPRIADCFWRGLNQSFDGGRLAGGAAAPMERRLVHLHSFAVELDRLRDRSRR